MLNGLEAISLGGGTGNCLCRIKEFSRATGFHGRAVVNRMRSSGVGSTCGEARTLKIRVRLIKSLRMET